MKYLNICYLLYFYSLFSFRLFLVLFFVIWPRWDLNIKSTYICFLLKKFTYHPLCVKSSELAPIYNPFPFPYHILSLKIRKSIFCKHSLFFLASMDNFSVGWFLKQQTGYSKMYPYVEHASLLLEPKNS